MNPLQEEDYSFDPKDSNLKVGDVILLMTSLMIPSSDKYSGVISADGVISKSVLVIPKTSEHGANVQTRSCLFRIENARRIEKHLEEADSELMMALGKSLTYGERVQLRHWHSKGFLTVNKKRIAFEPACLEVIIKDSGQEDSWFEIHPVNNLRKAGEVIKYSDIIYLRLIHDKSDYFLHFNSQNAENVDSKCEINACGNSSPWKVKQYMNFDLTVNTGQFVTTGDSLRIFHKLSEGYLAVEETIIFNDEDFYNPSKVPKVFVQKANRSSNSLWELQRVKTFVGGVASWNENFRIKHLATGKYLGKVGHNLVLSNKEEDIKYEFELFPQANTLENEIRFGQIFSLKNSNELLNVDYEEEGTTFIEKKKKTAFSLSFIKSKKEYAEVAFVFEDVPEATTSHVYKLNLMGPKLQDAYFYLKNSDLSEKTLRENPDKEGLLNQTSTQLKEMVKNVTSYVLLNSSEVDVIKRQNSMRELGIIDALLKLSDIIQFKIQNLILLPAFQRDASKFSSASGNGELVRLAEFYLDDLESQVYQLIYDSVKNNPKNCRSLIEYEEGIVPMLNGKSFSYIGKILREMFKYVLELSKYSEKRIEKWFQQLQKLELGNSNIKNTSMYLSMMKYLCQANGRAAVNYQAQFKNRLFPVEGTDGDCDTMKIIKAYIHNDKPCIELDYNRKIENLEKIFKSNLFLGIRQRVEPKSIPEAASDSLLYYLEDLCQDYSYTLYISSAIDFYTSICLCRYTSAIECVKKFIKFSPSFLILAIQSSVNYKLKASLVDLMTTVFIDVDPFIPSTKFKARCFIWDEQFMPPRLVCAELEHKPSFPEYFHEVCRMVHDFWVNDLNIDEKHLSVQLRLVTSYLKLTKVLLDLDALDNNFINRFQKILIFLVIGISDESHNWGSELITRVKRKLATDYKHSLDARFAEMLEVLMDVLNVMIIKRENLHVEALCKLFFSRRSESAHQVYKKGLADDFTRILDVLKWQCVEGNNSFHLEIYLLKLLFNSDKNVSKDVRKKALEMILADMNMRKTLKNELGSVEFLVDRNDQDTYSKLSSKSKEIYILIKTLLNYQAEKAESHFIGETIKSLSIEILELLQMYRNESANAYSRAKFQSFLRHTNIHEYIIKIFELNEITHRMIYKNCIDLLFNLTYENSKSQELLLPYVDLFLDKIDIGHGVAKLLAQILKRSGRHRKGNKVIKLISESMNKRMYEFHLLQLIRTFVYDENMQIIPKMQVDMLKWIFNNKKIKDMHFQHGSNYDYLDPKLPNPDTDPKEYKSALKFHCEVMKTLNICTYRNRFGIQQGRKLISIDNLFRTLKKKELNKYFKKTYFKFLYEVYMTEIDDRISPALEINHLEEIFREVVLIDLEEAINTVEILVNISLKGFYENIVCKKVSNLKIITFLNVINNAKPSEFEEEKQLKEKKKLKKIRLNHLEEHVLELWEYLSGGTSWHSDKDGLFHILREIFSHGQPKGEVQDLVEEIRMKLKTLSKTFEEVQKKTPSLDFSNIIMIINACREAMFNQAEDLEAEKLDEKVEALVIGLRDNIIDRKMSLEEMFAVFDTDKSGFISKTEFKIGIRCLMDADQFDLDTSFFYFSDSEDTLDVNIFSLKLRKYFYNKRLSTHRRHNTKRLTTSKFMNNPESYKENNELMQDFKEFIEDFDSTCKDQDITELVKKIKTSFVDPSIKLNNFSSLKEFVSKLGTAFKKKAHKIYLLQILKLLIPNDLELDEIFDENSKEKLAKLASIKNTQEVLSQAGVLELALDIITSEYEIELVDEAIQLLIRLLKFGNLKVQQQLLETLKSSENSFLFSYIRLKLRQSRDRIVERARVFYEKNPEKMGIRDLLRQTAPAVVVSGPSAVIVPLAPSSSAAEVMQVSPKSDYKSSHIQRLIHLLQLCCEDCYLDFQHFIRSQEYQSYGKKAISINMVNEIAQYLINIKEVGPELVNDPEAKKIIPQCFETLIDLCRGPCVENQLLLGQRRKLYKFVDNLIGMKAESEFFDCSIRFLKVLLDGECLPAIASVMIEEINFENLGVEAFEIYQVKIHSNKDQIIREFIGKDEDSFLPVLNVRARPMKVEDWKRVGSGFDIVIVLLKLIEKFPDAHKLKDLALRSRKDQTIPLVKRIQNIGGREESLFQGVLMFVKKYFLKEENVDEQTAYDFYLSLLGSVEIDRDGKLEKSFFRVPAMIIYLSNDLRDQLIYQVNRNSHEEKVKSIYQQSELVQIHMFHLQQLSRYRMLSWWASKYKSLADISFIIIVLINIIMLFSVSSSTDTNFNIGEFPGIVFVTILGVFLVCLSLLVYSFYIIENFPIIIYEHQKKLKDQEANKVLSQKLKGSIVSKYHSSLSKHPSDENINLWAMHFGYILLYPENFYNICYIILVCLALKWIFVYPFLLLDIVRRNENLRYILKAVTQNKRQLGLTVLLGLIFVYLFGVIGFISFYDYYREEDSSFYYCDSLVTCVTYTLYYGIRAGGGIGENLLTSHRKDRLYGWRHVFDLFFFIIVIIVLLNIIFGIIIDTFGELRDKRKKIEEDVNNVCIICGREKFEFELRGSGWNEHIHLEHNLFGYLAYIIYIRRKPFNECDGLEKYVKIKIGDDNVSFLPKTAMCFNEQDQEGNNLLNEIDQGIKNIEEVILEKESMKIR